MESMIRRGVLGGKQSVAANVGFTLIELLSVVGIIGMLIGLLLPSLATVRSQSRAVKCTSNIHQLGMAMRLYAADNRDNYPINVSSPSPKYWNDTDRLGQYVAPPLAPMSNSSVYWCPTDDGGQQSYSMNVWASSAADKTVTSLSTGTLWAHQRPSTAFILLADSWSYASGAGTGYIPSPVIGKYGANAGQRFGGGGGVGPITMGRWGPINCELAYARHRTIRNLIPFTQATGRVSIFFDDGHAALLSDRDLVSQQSGNSTGLAAWSVVDYVHN